LQHAQVRPAAPEDCGGLPIGSSPGFGPNPAD